MSADYTFFDDSPKPYAVYVHGIGSGSRSGTQSSLVRSFPEYEWLHPEFNEDPFEALDKLNEYISVFSPSIIAGTSFGGFLTAYCNAPDAVKIVCNSSIGIERILRKIGYGEHPFFCEREDGRSSYLIDEELARKFIRFREEHQISPGRINMGIYSMNDELAGQVESRKSAKFLEENGYHIFWSDKFGHRMNENVSKKIPRWLEELSCTQGL